MIESDYTLRKEIRNGLYYNTLKRKVLVSTNQVRLEFGRLENVDSDQLWFMLKVKELIGCSVCLEAFSQ